MQRKYYDNHARQSIKSDYPLYSYGSFSTWFVKVREDSHEHLTGWLSTRFQDYVSIQNYDPDKLARGYHSGLYTLEKSTYEDGHAIGYRLLGYREPLWHESQDMKKKNSILPVIFIPKRIYQINSAGDILRKN